MNNCVTMRIFAQKMGYLRSDNGEFRARLELLRKVYALEIQQGGFLGDSLHHPKIVVVKNWEAVNSLFGLPHEPKKAKSQSLHIKIYEFVCGSSSIACSFRRTLQRQGTVCTFQDTCNQKRFKSPIGEIENA